MAEVAWKGKEEEAGAASFSEHGLWRIDGRGRQAAGRRGQGSGPGGVVRLPWAERVLGIGARRRIREPLRQGRRGQLGKKLTLPPQRSW